MFYTQDLQFHNIYQQSGSIWRKFTVRTRPHKPSFSFLTKCARTHTQTTEKKKEKKTNKKLQCSTHMYHSWLDHMLYTHTHVCTPHTHFHPQQQGIRLTKRYSLCSSHSSDSSRPEALPSFPLSVLHLFFLYILFKFK